VDRVKVSPRLMSHHIIADRTRPMDFEVWSISSAKGVSRRQVESFDLYPLYANSPDQGALSDCYYVLNREPRLLSSKQRRQGTRSSGYVGGEVYLSLVSVDGSPVTDRVEEVEIVALCSNRDLPMQGAWGQGATDFDLQLGAPITKVRCIDAPSSPKASFSNGETNWRLINLLSVNYLSISGGAAGAETLRELLRVFTEQSEIATMQHLDGILSLDSHGFSARLPVKGPQAFGRGLEIDLVLDEGAFDRAEAFLFGAVIERFLGRHVTLNSFTRTRVLTRQRNEIMKWPIRAGHRTTL
jgi:type VI secretion system protein ImpG